MKRTWIGSKPPIKSLNSKFPLTNRGYDVCLPSESQSNLLQRISVDPVRLSHNSELFPPFYLPTKSSGVLRPIDLSSREQMQTISTKIMRGYPLSGVFAEERPSGHYSVTQIEIFIQKKTCLSPVVKYKTNNEKTHVCSHCCLTWRCITYFSFRNWKQFFISQNRVGFTSGLNDFPPKHWR